MAVKKELEKEVEEVVASEIIVGDPEILRPRELPLVVKMPEGKEWANKEQAEFAKVLNGYAYKNAAKWAIKKDVLIAQLKEIGENPSKFYTHMGVSEFERENSKLSFQNKLIQK